jgi:hypothetical protein
MNIDFTTIAHGIWCAYRKANQIIIRDREQWEDIWNQVFSETVPPPPVKEVDFLHEIVIAVFVGEKRSTGYSVEIVSIHTQPSQVNGSMSLIVKTKYREPSKGEVVGDALTQPHHIVKIPKVDFANAIFEPV